MARLNISIPDDLYEQAARWRGSMNLSELCANALRDELNAAEAAKTAYSVREAFRGSTRLERAVKRKYALTEVITCEPESTEPAARDTLGEIAAAYLDRHLCDDSQIAIGGGRQMWCLVRNLKPRSLKIDITAMGIQHNDPRALHAHPNTLLTLIWLMCGARSKAHLVGAEVFEPIWDRIDTEANHARSFVVASCAPFDGESPLVDLIGRDTTKDLLHRGARAEFAYTFLDKAGQVLPEVDFPSREHSILGADRLRRLSRRRDSRVMLVAGGEEKQPIIKQVLERGLCNVLITGIADAESLMVA